MLLAHFTCTEQEHYLDQKLVSIFLKMPLQYQCMCMSMNSLFTLLFVS